MVRSLFHQPTINSIQISSTKRGVNLQVIYSLASKLQAYSYLLCPEKVFEQSWTVSSGTSGASETTCTETPYKMVKKAQKLDLTLPSIFFHRTMEPASAGLNFTQVSLLILAHSAIVFGTLYMSRRSRSQRRSESKVVCNASVLKIT